ncbi:ATP-dependent DNA helicase PIF1 [Metarhizium robertsii ARSEF 23]|uniref:ATP-dependent DNA helicase n=1 Tax=Metarhizium robertsii (strain ARSEF 23 / ATCC MYA-3075) TaxID=655844 RepID=E9EMA2_METRA|nr:ATP-dependent DNA helicase PIF1 [Metarhizium robertsii ARSEF 23]EFZ04530.2 ATP-dependent DNA helicase PIF1 [Metarhizium robertsii ARSEF 23]
MTKFARCKSMSRFKWESDWESATEENECQLLEEMRPILASEPSTPRSASGMKEYNTRKFEYNFKMKINRLWVSEVFVDCIRDVYQSTSAANCKMRETVVDVARQHLSELWVRRPFKELIREGGDFGVDLMELQHSFQLLNTKTARISTPLGSAFRSGGQYPGLPHASLAAWVASLMHTTGTPDAFRQAMSNLLLQFAPRSAGWKVDRDQSRQSSRLLIMLQTVTNEGLFLRNWGNGSNRSCQGSIELVVIRSGENGVDGIEDDEYELEVHEEPVADEDWHKVSRMLPDRPLEEEDIDILGRRDININYDWAPTLEGTPTMAFSTVTTGSSAKRETPLTLMWIISLWRRGTPVWRAAPTGVVGNQISGTTLHSLLYLLINKDFEPLSPIDKAQLQKLRDIEYRVIDEKNILGLLQLSWIDNPLRQAFPSRNEESFGGLNILLVGDFFQLPRVLQKPLYYDKEMQGVDIKGRNA